LGRLLSGDINYLLSLLETLVGRGVLVPVGKGNRSLKCNWD
jgi:hypothetical protein